MCTNSKMYQFENMYDVIDKEFSLLMSPCRIYMIKKCLSYRYNIKEIL